MTKAHKGLYSVLWFSIGLIFLFRFE
jgi:hypothetical protein